MKAILNKLKWPLIGGLVLHAALNTDPGKKYTRLIQKTVG